MSKKWYARPHPLWIGINPDTNRAVAAQRDGQTKVHHYTLAVGDGQPLFTELTHSPKIEWPRFKTKREAEQWIAAYGRQQ